MKITKSEGKLVWAKNIICKNIMDDYQLNTHTYFDLMSNPRNESMIISSIKYFWNKGVG